MEHMSSPVRFRNKKAATLSEKELASLSISNTDDSQCPFAMRDLPPCSFSDHSLLSHPASVINSGAEVTNSSQPRTCSLPRPTPLSQPGSPVVPHRPGRSGSSADFSPALRRQLVSVGSLDSPLSPSSRPQSPWGRFDPYDSPEDQDKEYVGFATLPNQVHRKTVKKGFTFTVMVAGESGLGKSTLVNSLFLTDLYKDRKVQNAEERISQTVDIVKHTVSIEEKGVKLRLTIVDTPGFGDAVDNTESWKHLEEYIDQQFEQYFRDESGLNRRNIQDHRVHCCLYFISPYGHGLRPIDVQCLKALHEKVNIIPILAKADCLTAAERHKKKMKIREELKHFGVSIYQFLEYDSDEEDDLKRQDQILKDSIPFAIIGSNIQVESNGRRVRGRQYPWGVVEVENPVHSDFLLLRNMLVRSHMQDLKDVTRESHYENYRAQCIQSMTRLVVHERQRSLREKHREGSLAELPLPLGIDPETERLIFEKDEELRKMQEVLVRIQEQMKSSHNGSS
uniref:Septin-type G domain-containing protein n=1 Tax=Knipowitschia caucasica TaxID=637954 RepID=A0AAV2J6T4_KNICA